MGSFSIWHWLIVLGIVVLVFGTRKLRGAGSDIGAAVKNFKSAMNEGEAEATRRPGEIEGQSRPASSAEQTSKREHS